ncbi:IS3 family transposase (plasmid) [Streptomyces coelicoflavus]|nr:IS3 family transposase [Streptomyces anthocyanicus]
MVTATWEGSGRTYGARRFTRALVRAGHAVARCTVERLMRELGIEGVIRGQRALADPVGRLIWASTHCREPPTT